MDKRTLLALVLTAVVIVVTPLLIPGARRSTVRTDSAVAGQTTGARATTGATAASAASPTSTASSDVAPAPAAGSPVAAGGAAAGAPAVRAETLTVRRGAATYSFVNLGAAPLAVHLDDTLYRNLRAGQRGQGVTLAADRGRLLDLRLVAGGRDTIALDTIAFTGATTATGVTYTATNPAVTIAYTFGDQPYLFHLDGTASSLPAGSQLLVGLPQHLRSAEADTVDDLNHYAYGYKPTTEDVKSVPFSKLDTAQSVVRVDSGPMRWVAMRNKYFLVAAVAPTPATGFTTLAMRGVQRTGRVTSQARAVATAPVVNGGFHYSVYAGPQAWEALRRVGFDLENVNPYAGWFHAVVQPFSTIVMRVLLWMKRTLQVNYGWVLVIFGVVIRLLLWPLNQNAMRSSMKMQRIQPELQEVQRRYKTDPEKQREAMVKLYQEHGMSPFSPLMGCLPMLLPMPVLFALYFVFTNTIEFRGVSFLWLPDLAAHDPYFITPIFMGLSMFVLSWLGMRNMPPNPQSRTMAFVMPVMMTVMFMRFASGLNLYYAVQNIAALPQQWMIARERAAAGTPVGSAPRAATPARGASAQVRRR